MANPVRRVWNSFRTNGLPYTLRRGREHIDSMISRHRDRDFDERYGTDTTAVVEVEEMDDVKSANRPYGIRYEPTRARPLLALLRGLRLPGRAVMLDIGCGKGRAMMVAVQAGILRVDGVDYSPRLCAVAEQNLERFRQMTGVEFQFNVTACDAVDVEIAPEHNLVFMFNPFGAPVLEQVLDRLDASLASHPRDLWIVYHHPLWQETIAHRPRYARVLERNIGGCDFVVYRTRAQGAGVASASTVTS